MTTIAYSHSPLPAGGWRLEAGGWRLEAGGWGLEAGGWRLKAGGWRLVVGVWRPEGDLSTRLTPLRLQNGKGEFLAELWQRCCVSKMVKGNSVASFGSAIVPLKW